MPLHDWHQVDAGVVHDFHLCWLVDISRELNTTILPDACYALIEKVAHEFEPIQAERFEAEQGGIDAAMVPPQTAVNATLPPRPLAAPLRCVAIRRCSDDRLIAIVQIVPPQLADDRRLLEYLAARSAVAIREGIHLMLLDVFTPNALHRMIWSKLGGHAYEPPPGKPLTLSAYNAGTVTCYVEPTAVGTALVDMPLFLTPQRNMNVPLEQTYMTAYEGVPKRWKTGIEAGR